MAEYVLPKFEIGFDSPEHFTLADKTAYVVVRAKYTNGKPMRGTAVVTIEGGLRSTFGFDCYGLRGGENKLRLQKTVIVDGREKVEFGIEDELECDQIGTGPKLFKVKAEVTETLTGLSQSTEKTIQVHKEIFKISSNLNNIRLNRDSTINVTVRKFSFF